MSIGPWHFPPSIDSLYKAITFFPSPHTSNLCRSRKKSAISDKLLVSIDSKLRIEEGLRLLSFRGKRTRFLCLFEWLELSSFQPTQFVIEKAFGSQRRRRRRRRRRTLWNFNSTDQKILWLYTLIKKRSLYISRIEPLYRMWGKMEMEWMAR